MDTWSYPVIVVRSASRPAMSSRQPSVWESGANGWIEANSGQEMASISAVAFSFMVHEPSGIMVRSSARSRSESLRM
nr:hypothetical protein [Arthrobacter sp. Soil761]